MAECVKGRIKWFNVEERCGFVVPDDGSEGVIVFHSDFRDRVQASDLRPGGAVEYEVDRTSKRHRAVHVVFLGGGEKTERVGGIVKWFSSEKRHGFVQRDDQLPDVFLHASDLSREMRGHQLAEGDAVEFRVQKTARGPRAVDVVVTGEGSSNGRQRGCVKWFAHAKRYGFIQCDSGQPDIFVHRGDFRAPDDVRGLSQGDRVEFCVAIADRGPKAVDVVVTGSDDAQPARGTDGAG